MTVLYQDSKVKHGKPARWICQCECGSEPKSIASSQLRSGNTSSCGCLRNELSAKRMKEKIKRNNYEIKKDFVVMYASNTGTPFFIDIEDLEKIKDYTWVENKRGYITQTNSRRRLHQFIKGKAPEGYVIDHADRNKLNNRQNNLIFKTQSDNTINRSINKGNLYGVSGVHPSTSSNFPYGVTLGAGGRLFRGYYTNLEDAIKARLKAEKEFLGDKSPQKHLFKEYGIE